MGGVSYPLLADFHPKGDVAKAHGLYLEEAGISDRATVIVDKDGVVRYVASATPAGKREIADLAAECEKVDAEYGGGLGDLPNLG
jgi:alkyl hydroperoxide reductase subunit AhpC